MNRAIFVDRDGVLIKQKNHLSKKGDIEIIPGAPEAVSLMNKKGYKVIGISNQSVVARGLCTLKDVEDIHRFIINKIEVGGGKIERIYFCPHHPKEGINPEYTHVCNCRKPEIGMLVQAANDFDIDLRNSYFIDDKLKDIKTGIQAGCKTILVKTGYGGRDYLTGNIEPEFVAKDIFDAARRIIK